MCTDAATLLFQTAAGMSMNLSASHLCHASARARRPIPAPHSPTHPAIQPSTHRPRINDCLPSFAPNHDRDAEAIENVYSDCENPPCFHKVARFHFDGIANHRNVIYVCFELEMSPACDIGGGPTLLGAAKPYGEFIRRVAFSLGTTDWRQTNLALRLLRRSDCQIYGRHFQPC